MEQRNNTFTIFSMIFGILTVFSFQTVIFPYFFGSLAIIFAILSKGSSFKMTSLAKTAVTLSVSGIIMITAFEGFKIYKFYTDEEYFAESNAAFEKVYGITLEEYINMLEETYKTGEIPEELQKKLEGMGY